MPSKATPETAPRSRGTGENGRGGGVRQRAALPRCPRILVDLALVALLLGLTGHLLWTGLERARIDSDLAGAVSEAKALYDGLVRFHEINQSYPNSYADPRLDPQTLDPLRRRGYYHGHLGRYLQDGRIDAYDSPDDLGRNREFWLEMTLAAAPDIRLLVVRSDGAPMSGGEWLDGVYVARDGQLRRY